MNEEEIINIAEDFVNYIRFKKKTKYSESQWFMAIEDLLDMYRQEKEKNKKLEEEWDKALIDMYFKKEEVCNKVIDMMAKDISNSDIDEDICRQFKMKEDCYADITEDNSACLECIKEYYFKKARGEENETN